MFEKTVTPRYVEGIGKRTILTGTSGLLLGVVSEGPPTRWDTGKSVLPEGDSHLTRLSLATFQQAAGQRLPGWEAHHLGQLYHQQGRGDPEAGRGWAAGPAWFLTLGIAPPP